MHNYAVLALCGFINRELCKYAALLILTKRELVKLFELSVMF